jgi:hypothetical protein
MNVLINTLIYISCVALGYYIGHYQGYKNGLAYATNYCFRKMNDAFRKYLEQAFVPLLNAANLKFKEFPQHGFNKRTRFIVGELDTGCLEEIVELELRNGRN